MALHKNFPSSLHDILDPEIRWFPADAVLRETNADKLTPWFQSGYRRPAGRLYRAVDRLDGSEDSAPITAIESLLAVLDVVGQA
jgi:hypothetical protein